MPCRCRRLGSIVGVVVGVSIVGVGICVSLCVVLVSVAWAVNSVVSGLVAFEAFTYTQGASVLVVTELVASGALDFFQWHMRSAFSGLSIVPLTFVSRYSISSFSLLLPLWFVHLADLYLIHFLVFHNVF